MNVAWISDTQQPLSIRSAHVQHGTVMNVQVTKTIVLPSRGTCLCVCACVCASLFLRGILFWYTRKPCLPEPIKLFVKIAIIELRIHEIALLSSHLWVSMRGCH